MERVENNSEIHEIEPIDEGDIKKRSLTDIPSDCQKKFKLSEETANFVDKTRVTNEEKHETEIIPILMSNNENANNISDMNKIDALKNTDDNLFQKVTIDSYCNGNAAISTDIGHTKSNINSADVGAEKECSREGGNDVIVLSIDSSKNENKNSTNLCNEEKISIGVEADLVSPITSKIDSVPIKTNATENLVNEEIKPSEINEKQQTELLVAPVKDDTLINADNFPTESKETVSMNEDEMTIDAWVASKKNLENVSKSLTQSDKKIPQSLSKKKPSSLSGETMSKQIGVLDELFSDLEPLPETIEKPLHALSSSEIQELEAVLEFRSSLNTDDSESGWRNDWSGNLAYVDKEIYNPLYRVKNLRSRPKGGSNNTGTRGRKATEKMTLLKWAQVIEENGAAVAKTNAVRRMLKYLLRHVCTFGYTEQPDTSTKNNGVDTEDSLPPKPQINSTPVSVIKLFSSIDVDSSPLSDVEDAIRRASYDPQILMEDGWTIKKSSEFEGATGGPFRIGDKIRYEGSDAVVIAYTHDNDIGDLWKAIWIEDYVSFDLEAEELLQARRKWERYYKRPEKGEPEASKASVIVTSRRKPLGREAAIGASGSLDFTVRGIEYGIVLAASYSKGARPGIYWPARVIHASQTASNAIRRNSSKTQKKLDLVFLAPYWNSIDDTSYGANKNRVGPSLSENQESAFSSAPLFQFETVDATDEMVKEFPPCEEGEDAQYIEISKLKMFFRFTGLPKSAFPRFLDAYRIAYSLREYAKSNLQIIKPMQSSAAAFRATAALFEAHPLAVQVPTFPIVILNLPYQFILSELTKTEDVQRTTENASNKELVIKLSAILDAMKPPHIWGKEHVQISDVRESSNGFHNQVTNGSVRGRNSSSGVWLETVDNDDIAEHTKTLGRFMLDFPSLNNTFDRFYAAPSIAGLLSCIHQLFLQISSYDTIAEEATQRHNRIISTWALMKRMGDDSLATVLIDGSPFRSKVIFEWRRASERIYRYLIGIITKLEVEKEEALLTLVITDSLCNEHRTSSTCLERRVRLPAALKGAKLAGAKPEGPIRLISSIPSGYVDYVEEKLINKAHSSAYVKRMKSRCTSANSYNEVLVLTDDSDGNGGDDTRGSQGTWNASLCAVAAAVAASDMVVRGKCVNAFCVTRPPGHHAGRSLHPMKAISNGFCILNPVACTAIHATTPVSDGGLGLNRVCIIDFDVHHGNGTQDILCSTYDPRFLYVSLHAGGAHINGLPQSEDPGDEPYGLTTNPKLLGIYPGRCGDTSPHSGVLNIPLGARVTSHAVGTALLQHVTPSVDNFSPDLIILSAGFDAHKNDPMGLGGLSAEDFGNITEVACQLAFKSCSGRILSILEGGYGVPCCRPQVNTFLPQVNTFLPAVSKAANGSVSRPESSTVLTSASMDDIPSDQTTSLPPVSKDVEESSGEVKTLDTSKLQDINMTPQAKELNEIKESLDILEAHDSKETHSIVKQSENISNLDSIPASIVAPNNDNTAVMTTSSVLPVAGDHEKRATSIVPELSTKGRPQPSRLLDLGEDLPDEMDDQVPYPLQLRLEKCNAEGFVECVYEHVSSLSRCNVRQQ